MRPSEHLLTVKCNLISMPQNDVLLANKMAKLSEKFVQCYKRKPTTFELSEMTGEEEKKIKEVLPSLDGFAVGCDDIDNYYKSDGGYTTDDAICKEGRNREIGRILDSFLSPRCAYIVRSVFGIGGRYEKTFASLAEELNMTRERVRQLYESSIRSMRNDDKVRNYLLMVA